MYLIVARTTGRQFTRATNHTLTNHTLTNNPVKQSVFSYAEAKPIVDMLREFNPEHRWSLVTTLKSK